MLSVLVDTSTWLDLARKRDGQTLVVPLRLFVYRGELRLLVPSLVVEEFDRNRPSAEDRVTKTVEERFRDLRRDLQDYGGEHTQEWLDEMTHHVPMLSATTLQNFREIRALLDGGVRLEPTPDDHERVVRRALEKRAPFHLPKNSVADAMLLELYRTTVEQGAKGESFAFATSNHKDFSTPNGDRRQPHPDLAGLFDDSHSRYCLGVDGLRQLMNDQFGEAFQQEVEEIEFLRSVDEPRAYGEIFEAAEEYFDKVWHVRHLIHLEKEERGEIAPMAPEIRVKAEAAAQRIVERYGAENVGPWNDWEWGYVNGKLATLRWVLGSEWDFLDT